MLDSLYHIEQHCTQRILSYDGTDIIIPHVGFQLEVYDMLRMLAKQLQELKLELR